MPSFNNEALREIDRKIGYHIRTLRHEREISLFNAATYIAVSTQQLQKYETGVNRISAARLYALCQLFDIPAENFFNAAK